MTDQVSNSSVHGGSVYAGFDTNTGVTVTNNTDQNIYLQWSSTAFEKITPGNTSTAHKAYFNYVIRNDDSSSGSIYSTIKVSAADGSVNIVSGTLRGSVEISVNLA